MKVVKTKGWCLWCVEKNTLLFKCGLKSIWVKINKSVNFYFGKILEYLWFCKEIRKNLFKSISKLYLITTPMALQSVM